MLRKHASLVIAVSLVAMVTAACIVRTHNGRRAQPVYVEKQKPMKHKHEKHKEHHKHR
jgi:ABC-type nickel/cobalt efflux system permease component RcnA